MATELYFSTGQAAREWGVSVATVRALCAAGAIDPEVTPGGQYRIASSVVEKLRRDGLPTVPRPLPGDNPRPARSGHGHPALLGEPSEDVIDSAEEVVCLENEVKSLGLRRQKEEQLDWFPEREESRTEREAQRQETERKRQAQIATEQRRQQWTDKWLAYALDSLPYDAPREIGLDVHQAVEEALAKMQPSQPDYVTERSVDAAVERALAPWKRRKEIEAAIEQASWSAPTEWELRAKQAASEAIAELREGATPEEIRAAARHAVQPIIKQFEHEQACEEVLSWVPLRLRGDTADDREQAKIAVRAALDDGAPLN